MVVIIVVAGVVTEAAVEGVAVEGVAVAGVIEFPTDGIEVVAIPGACPGEEDVVEMRVGVIGVEVISGVETGSI